MLKTGEVMNKGDERFAMKKNLTPKTKGSKVKDGREALSES